MPDIVNNVINGIYPASGHNIYVVELAPFRLAQPYFQQFKYFGGYRVAKNITGSRSYVWDLYLLSLYAKNDSFGIYVTKKFSSDYKPLYCSNFTDNAGQNIYQPVRNFSGFSFNPILSTNVNQQYPAEIILYRASFIPLYPLLFCSSIPTHRSFGPAFVNSFTISVDGMENLGDVEISCSVSGGRSLISPTGVSTTRPQLLQNYIKMKTLNTSDNQNITVESNNFLNKYRAINLSDCAFYQGLYLKFDDFAKAVQNSYSSQKMPIYKIVSMSLSIDQNIDFSFTYPGYSFDNSLTEFTDVVGPRFASLGSRTVKGSIKLFSPQNYSFITTNASSLTLYFGSVFYYTMKNVDWQQPVITISPGGGYFIEYNFSVRLTEITSFNGLGNTRVSEFL
jgi:hypothetical protein